MGNTSAQLSISSDAIAERARRIPLVEPALRGNEWAYLKECLDTNYVSSIGPFVDRFESAVAQYTGTRHAVATCSGTAALHVALLVAGVQPDDEVLLPPLTFIAPANAVRYVGAWPVFIDVEPVFWQMDPGRLVDCVERQCRWRDGELSNGVTGRRVKAVLPVHLLGHPADMDPILEVARKYNLVVVEDATESIGARYRGRSVAGLGDIACLSFNGNKLVTAGGGGMVLTDRDDWARRARYLTTQAKDDPVEFVHNEIGYNYRLTNIQAALGLAQLESLEHLIAAKRCIASTYKEKLSGVEGITPMQEASWAYSVFWMYTVLVNEGVYGMNARTLMGMLEAVGIQTRPLWQPLHLSPAHRRPDGTACPVAERIYRDALSLPCSTSLTHEQQHRVLKALASSSPGMGGSS